MVSVNTAYSATSYANLAATAIANSAKTTSATTPAPAGTSESAATSVTLSDAAKAALQVKDLATVLGEARQKLTASLTGAGRTSPLQGGKLALDMTGLDARELFAIANSSDDSFTADEKTASGLEMQRRFDAAMAGPAAIADVTGSYAGLYQAAADYLDKMGPEERADAKTVAARAALTEAGKQLATDPKTLPDVKDDPIALYLALAEAGETTAPRDITDVAGDVRSTLDKKYADAVAGGKAPTFNKNTKVGTYIDLSTFDSRSLSAMVLNSGSQFSPEEVGAANTAMRAKSGAALLAGFQSAAKSSDPTAFSQNIISIYSSMSAEERQAAGWSDSFYQAAVDSYATTTKLTQMFADAGADTTSFMSWMGK
ncbi:hypothetical protein [uncultured Devosia sp.]|uniref:hypothetical protein n=1 Tax=uncultured Devosia sp. TaxID=211434 RepID=UPI0035CB2E65